MKVIKIVIIFSFLFYCNSFSQNINPNFDYSGVYEFYKIVDILKQNREPTSSKWNRLFQTPGYKVLIKGEFTKDFFKQNFRLVFMPSKKFELNRKLKNKYHLQHLMHYIKVRDNKNKMMRQLENLKSIPYNRKAITRTLKFLPQNRVSVYPPVAFVIFENNGRGSSPIVVDLAASIEWDFVSFLSHEFHHWYRNRQLKFNYNNIRRNDMLLVQAFDHIEAEGIADMVDKRDWFTKASNSVSLQARQFINDVSRTPYIIKQMDRILIKAEQYPSSRNRQGNKLLNLLPEKGHTTGYFMASLILEEFGKDKLVSCVGNPFKFIKTYNDAAKISKRYPSLSESAMNVINEYEDKYIKN